MYSYGIVLNASNYSNLFASANSANFLSVPVNPSSVIYSQFKHVHGIPATSNQTGIPINRIRILDNLIGQLQKMKKPVESNNSISQMTQEQQDALIKQYQETIRKTLQETYNSGNYGFAGLMPETGSVVNINA